MRKNTTTTGVLWVRRFGLKMMADTGVIRMKEDGRTIVGERPREQVRGEGIGRRRKEEEQ